MDLPCGPAPPQCGPAPPYNEDTEYPHVQRVWEMLGSGFRTVIGFIYRNCLGLGKIDCVFHILAYGLSEIRVFGEIWCNFGVHNLNSRCVSDDRPSPRWIWNKYSNVNNWQPVGSLGVLLGLGGIWQKKLAKLDRVLQGWQAPKAYNISYKYIIYILPYYGKRYHKS